LRYSDLLAKKSQILPTPSHFCALVWGDPFKFMEKNVTVPEAKVFLAADGKNLVILSCSVFD